MKRIIRFFVVCLALSALQTGSVFGIENTKTQSKRSSANTISTTKTSSRSSASTKQKNTSKQETEDARTTKITRNAQTSVKNRATATSAVKNQVVKQRNSTQQKKVSTVARNASSTNVKPSTKTTTARTTTKQNLSRATRSQVILNNEKIANIKAKDYTKCKTVFYDCMDEFCANKDANLRRCSCSSRIHEFDNIKKQLSAVEDKMLDYNQRLLTVSLSKEDAAAINRESEGELGFNTKDKTESEKLLQKITNSLNSSSDSKFNNDLSAISLDLDMDSAWDNVDSMSGISTTSKNGVELYNAATPVCIEMAKEVCSEDELEIVQGNYKLAIQQDCNTVSKSYSSQYNQAMNKIHESGALLDMARLNKYQQQNADDVLTCKKKILEQLNDSSVCGENLYKCLDMTGQYINPATGEAFLSSNLYNITTLLTAPSGKETWSGLKQNEKFVAFLNSKKMYLESATEQCKTMADVVWKDFLNDALAKIKLAQNAKLEEIRQSCTTLVAECKNTANANLAEFDARALSTFSVMADTTVNSLCADVQSSCVSLMEKSGGGEIYWQEGMETITLDTTLDKILDTCTTVGKDCIIKQCNGTSGNFALCEDFADQPRRTILSRKACWNEVIDCITQADNYMDINTNNLKLNYGLEKQSYEICDENDKSCKIAEYIWGNCEHNALTTAITQSEISGTKKSNMILTPLHGETLLSWFAYNTGTTTNIDSCSAYSCPTNYKFENDKCIQFYDGDTNQVYGVPENKTVETLNQIITVSSNVKNYCEHGVKDSKHNCCFDGHVSGGICVPSANSVAIYIGQISCQNEPDNIGDSYYCDNNPTMSSKLYCVIENGSSTTKIPVENGILSCPGMFVFVNNLGNYYIPQYIGDYDGKNIMMLYFYKDANQETTDMCEYKYDNNQWDWNGHCNSSVDINSAELMVEYY